MNNQVFNLAELLMVNLSIYWYKIKFIEHFVFTDGTGIVQRKIPETSFSEIV
jgi:hypothetical protein